MFLDPRAVNPNVLLVDADLYFAFWFGRALDSAGYEVFPAKSVGDALKLVAEFDLAVSILIIDAALPGAAELAATLRETEEHLRIVRLAGPGETDANSCPWSDCICLKPSSRSNDSKAELLLSFDRAVAAPPRRTVGSS